MYAKNIENVEDKIKNTILVYKKQALETATKNHNEKLALYKEIQNLKEKIVELEKKHKKEMAQKDKEIGELKHQLKLA